MHRATANNPNELQKRHTERARLKAEEKDLNKMIEKTKAQLIQLQVEALDIKSRIRSTSQKADKRRTRLNSLRVLITYEPTSTLATRRKKGN